MGSFFTNVHVRVPDGGDPEALVERLRGFVERQLEDEGYVIAIEGPADREILIVPTKRWLAFYEPRMEDQGEHAELWARGISEALETEAVSVLVHDSDVLALGLFARGKRRDAFDSNPGFSGKQPSKLTPQARARKWAGVVVPKHEAKLEAAFGSRGVFAERALTPIATAIGASVETLATGYNYLTRDDEVPPNAVRVRGRFAKRPPWEKRKTGAPRLVSQWHDHGHPPALEPHRVLVGQPLHATAIAKNRGGGAPGLRIAIDVPDDCIALTQVEAVITKPGRFAMDRHLAVLAPAGGRFVAELPDVQLQPGFDGPPDALRGAPLDAMMDARCAGQIHLNIHGTACRAGATTLSVELVPLANPRGAHVERVAIEVTAPRGVPLRAPNDLQPHLLDRLTSDAHSFLLVLLDAPRDRVKTHAIELLASVRSLWPKAGTWSAFALGGDDMREVKVKRGTAAWTSLEEAIRGLAGQITASHTPPSTHDSSECSGFEIDLTGELGVIAIWLARSRSDRDAVERALVAGVDAIAKKGKLVQALLARWENDSASPSYEDVVGLHGDYLTSRAWATRWLRGIGLGQLWLGPALRARIPATLPDLVELGPAVRIAVTDVAATEAVLAELLPSRDDGHAFAREHAS